MRFLACFHRQLTGDIGTSLRADCNAHILDAREKAWNQRAHELHRQSGGLYGWPAGEWRESPYRSK